MLLAMDRQSVRTVSKDGHLHVAASHISKANVCPYEGAEIPNCEALGLDAERVYQLWRHPDELKRAAPTFNNLPILIRHVPVTSADHPHDLVVGSTGTDGTFNAPYLDNSLVIWDDEAIAGIESDQQRELSSAYHYIAEMTAGEIDGLHYDGIMRNIVGNHVALVEEGRAGSDVIVGDSKIGIVTMAQRLKSRKALMVAGSLHAYLKPKLAADAKIDLSPILGDVTAKNFKGRKGGIVKALTTATKGKLAADATLEDVVELLDTLEDVTDGELDDDAIAEAAEAGGGEPEGSDLPEEDKPAATDADGDKIAQLLEFLKGKLSDEDLAAAMELVGASADKPDDGGEDPADTTPVGDFGGHVEKPGMDAKTIGARVMRQVRELRDAERAVAPLVGEVVAMDSATDVYKFALEQAGVSIKGVHPSAYPSLVAMAVKNKTDAAKPRRELAMAHDAAPAGNSVQELFPNAIKPKRI